MTDIKPPQIVWKWRQYPAMTPQFATVIRDEHDHFILGRTGNPPLFVRKEQIHWGWVYETKGVVPVKDGAMYCDEQELVIPPRQRGHHAMPRPMSFMPKEQVPSRSAVMFSIVLGIALIYLVSVAAISVIYITQVM